MRREAKEITAEVKYIKGRQILAKQGCHTGKNWSIKV